MSENIEQADALTTLKARADQIGLKYHPSIGLDKLRAKVNAALAGEELPEDEEDEAQDEASESVESTGTSSIPKPQVNLTTAKPAAETKEQRRLRLFNESRELVRIRITCMNPLKKEWQGEQFSVANSLISVNRFVPFETEWHVERLILNMIKERQYLAFIERKSGPAGIPIKEHRLIREFAVEVLDPLTEQELKALAQRQAMAQGTSEA